MKKEEEFRTITRDLTKSNQIFEKRTQKYEDMLEKFTQSVKGVFDGLDSNAQLSTDDLVLAVRIVSDAKPLDLYYLRNWMDLILNRMRSRSPVKLKRALIGALLERYFSQFLKCLEDHDAFESMISRMLILSSTALIDETNTDYLDFLRNTVSPALKRQLNEQKKRFGANVGSD